MTQPDLTGLPPITEQPPSDITMFFAELEWLIGDAIRNHPRSRQKKLGPSEIGVPCARRLGYKLTDTLPVNERDTAWKPTVGTAVHTWLESAFKRANRILDPDNPRFLLEHRVEVGETGGQTIDGSCDLFDRVTRTVVDWKIVGVGALRKYASNGPGEQYRTQAHAYGRGWQRRGLTPRYVAIYFLPQNGELTDAYVWHEPYDETIAVKALERLDGITTLVSDLQSAALPLLPTADAWCVYCPWFMPASTVITEACPGHPGAVTQHRQT
ncbi:MAG: hypothetical protein ACRDQA_20110 [Nocardioidaceae bacterium]